MRLIGLLDGILCVRSYMYAKQPSFIYAPAYRIGTDAYVSDGRDLSTLPSNDSQAILKISYIASILYCPHVLAARISLLYILIKIFWPFRRIIATYVLIALNVLYYIIIVFIKAFTCRPPSAYWAPEDRSGGACMSRRDILMADSVVSMVSDLAVALLPIVYMWSSHLPVKDKLKVFGTLGIGGIAIAFSIYRLVIIAIDVVFTQHDTSVFVKTLMCGNAEGGIGIICACIPTFSAFTLQKRRNRSPFHSQEEARYINSSSSWNPSCYTPDRQTSQITSSAGRSSTDSVVNTTMQDQEESDSGPGSRPCGQWLIYRQVSLHQDCTAVSHCHEAMP